MAGPNWFRGDHDRRHADFRTRPDYGQSDYSTDFQYDPQGRRVSDERPDDYGQADYSSDYAYDPENRRGYRTFDGGRPEDVAYDERGRAYRRAPESDRVTARDRHRRDGPSDRVIWAVITERLSDERGLDLRDVEVVVDDREVTLNGTVRRKSDRRRIEDVADIEGVRHVQNNLRVRERSPWSLF
mgnify:CR=1 FL=1